ncbi:hypothetical protein Tco_0237033 [Tanacetum coccineum]
MVDEDKEIDERILSTEEVLSTDKEGVSTDFEKVSTEEHNKGTEEKNKGTKEQKEGTEEKVESADGQIKGTEDQTEEEIATQATQTSTQTPTSMIFGDDETIAKVLLNMSQAKAVSKEKEKGVVLKDVEETERPRPTSTRSLLTLKPLPKIDPKDKGKKKIKWRVKSEKEWEAEERRRIEADRILDDMPSRSMKRGGAVHNRRKSKISLYGSVEDDRLIKRMNKKILQWRRDQAGFKEEAMERGKGEEKYKKRKLGHRDDFSTIVKSAFTVFETEEDLDDSYKLVDGHISDKIPKGFD